MLDKERLYKELHGVLGDQQNQQQGVYIPASTALIWFVVFVFMLVWIGVDLFDAVHAGEALTIHN